MKKLAYLLACTLFVICAPSFDCFGMQEEEGYGLDPITPAPKKIELSPEEYAKIMARLGKLKEVKKKIAG